MARCALSTWPGLPQHVVQKGSAGRGDQDSGRPIWHFSLLAMANIPRTATARSFLPRAFSQPTMRFPRLFASKLVKILSMGLDHLAVSLELLLGRLWLRD
jgi:hypothetical protein